MSQIHLALALSSKLVVRSIVILVVDEGGNTEKAFRHIIKSGYDLFRSLSLDKVKPGQIILLREVCCSVGACCSLSIDFFSDVPQHLRSREREPRTL